MNVLIVFVKICNCRNEKTIHHLYYSYGSLKVNFLYFANYKKKISCILFFDNLEAKSCVCVEIDCIVNEYFGLVVVNGKYYKKC